MATHLRRLLRWCIWIILAFSVLVDLAVADAAFGGGDIAFFDQSGRMVFPSAMPQLWLPVIWLVFVQSFLVLALIRLREPRQPQSIFPAASRL